MRGTPIKLKGEDIFLEFEGCVCHSVKRHNFESFSASSGLSSLLVCFGKKKWVYLSLFENFTLVCFELYMFTSGRLAMKLHCLPAYLIVALYYSAKPKGSICSLVKWADAASWLRTAEKLPQPRMDTSGHTDPRYPSSSSLQSQKAVAAYCL